MLITLPSVFCWPQWRVPWSVSPPTTLSTLHTFNDSDDAAAVILRIPRTGTLSKVHFLCGTVGTTNYTARISFQDIDLTSGFPDGTVDQYRTWTPSSNTFISTGLITSDGTDTGTQRSVTAGNLLAVVWDFSAYTSGSYTINHHALTGAQSFPYHTTWETAWAKSVTKGFYSLALEYSDGTIVLPDDCIPYASTFRTDTINTGTTPDESGIVITMPFEAECSGFNVFSDLDGNADVCLYDGGSTILRSQSLDLDVRLGTASGWFIGSWAPIVLGRGQTYRLTVLPTSATSLAIYGHSFPSQAWADRCLGGAGVGYRTTRTDAGAWTDTLTEKMFLGLVLSKLHDGRRPTRGRTVSR